MGPKRCWAFSQSPCGNSTCSSYKDGKPTCIYITCNKQQTESGYCACAATFPKVLYGENKLTYIALHLEGNWCSGVLELPVLHSSTQAWLHKKDRNRGGSLYLLDGDTEHQLNWKDRSTGMFIQGLTISSLRQAGLTERAKVNPADEADDNSCLYGGTNIPKIQYTVWWRQQLRRCSVLSD